MDPVTGFGRMCTTIIGAIFLYAVVIGEFEDTTKRWSDTRRRLAYWGSTILTVGIMLLVWCSQVAGFVAGILVFIVFLADYPGLHPWRQIVYLLRKKAR